MRLLKITEIEKGLRGIFILSGIILILTMAAASLLADPSESAGSHPWGRTAASQALSKVALPTGHDSMGDKVPLGSGDIYFYSTAAVVNGCSVNETAPTPHLAICQGTRESNLNRFDALTTTALVSSKKALEFTLVGARPSGTS